MAKPVKVKLDTRGGMAALLRGPEVAGMVRGEADRVARIAGPGFEADTWLSPVPGSKAPARVIAGVAATTIQARVRNARDHTLLRALMGGSVPPELQMVTYTRKDGTTRKATKAQADNWMRQRKGG